MTKRAIFPLTDKEIVHAFTELNDRVEATSITYYLASGRQCNQDNISQTISDTDSFIIKSSIYWAKQSPHGSATTCSITYKSPGQTQDFDPYSSQLDFGDVSHFQNTLEKNADDVVKLAHKLFRVGGYSSTKNKHSKNEKDNIFSLTNAHVSLIKQLESGILRNTEELRKFIQDSASEYDRKNKIQDKEHKDRLRDLEERYQERTKEFEKRETIIQEKQKEIDNSDNTTARRKIRSDIIGTITERNKGLRLSTDTNNKRLAVSYLFYIALFGFLLIYILNIYYGNTLYIHADEKWDMIFVKLFRNLLPVGGFFATLFILIRWQNSWAQRHADAEFAQRQFELDIHRASWAVETALEWNRQSASTIPPELLSGMTRSLFDGGKSSSDDNTALDVLASALLGQAQQVRLRQGENELEFGSRGIRKLAKTPLKKAGTEKPEGSEQP